MKYIPVEVTLKDERGDVVSHYTTVLTAEAAEAVKSYRCTDDPLIFVNYISFEGGMGWHEYRFLE